MKLGEWPETGDVTDGFCRTCHSHFCPHARPHIYQAGWATQTKRRPGEFEGATNTIVLDQTHERGIARGLAGQRYAADQLGVPLTESTRAPYDLIAADGTRIDVKTSRHGMPLMVPKTQTYKLDPARIDALILVWDGPGGHHLVGQISVTDFLERCQDDVPLPVPTLCVPAPKLDPIPQEWRTT